MAASLSSLSPTASGSGSSEIFFLLQQWWWHQGEWWWKQCYPLSLSDSSGGGSGGGDSASRQLWWQSGTHLPLSLWFGFGFQIQRGAILFMTGHFEFLCEPQWMLRMYSFTGPLPSSHESILLGPKFVTYRV